jgi:hypothetical protein
MARLPGRGPFDTGEHHVDDPPTSATETAVTQPNPAPGCADLASTLQAACDAGQLGRGQLVLAGDDRPLLPLLGRERVLLTTDRGFATFAAAPSSRPRWPRATCASSPRRRDAFARRRPCHRTR